MKKLLFFLMILGFGVWAEAQTPTINVKSVSGLVSEDECTQALASLISTVKNHGTNSQQTKEETTGFLLKFYKNGLDKEDFKKRLTSLGVLPWCYIGCSSLYLNCTSSPTYPPPPVQVCDYYYALCILGCNGGDD